MWILGRPEAQLSRMVFSLKGRGKSGKRGGQAAGDGSK
jgi:hypothetical protein